MMVRSVALGLILLAAPACVRSAGEGEGGSPVSVPQKTAPDQVTLSDEGPTTWSQDFGGNDDDEGPGETGGFDPGDSSEDSEEPDPSGDWDAFVDEFIEQYCETLDDCSGGSWSCEDLGIGEDDFDACAEENFDAAAADDCIHGEWSMCEDAFPVVPAACEDVCPND